MDLNQIIIQYNPAWTRIEIIAVSLVLLVYALFAALLIIRGHFSLLQAIAIFLELVFMAIVLGSTVFTRNPTGEYRSILTPFWSWVEALTGNHEMLKEDILNICLLVPFGFLIPFCLGHKIHALKGLGLGLLFSGFIETQQIILQRGWFEVDDLMNNSFGCMLGCIIGSWVLNDLLKSKHK